MLNCWMRRITIGLASTLSAVGCGGAAPLMHPAQPLARNEVTFGVGTSQQFVMGDADSRIGHASEALLQTGDDPQANEEFVRGAVAWSLMTPGLAPWVGGRVGLGHHAEAGLTYTGRSLRGDGRFALEGESTALSLELGVSSRLRHPDEDMRTQGIPGLNDGGLAGFGLDLPLLLGWHSSGDILSVYAGPRAGFEYLFGTYVVDAYDAGADVVNAYEADVNARRWFAGGVLGVVIGVQPIRAGLELDIAYQRGDGRLGDVRNTDLAASIAPNEPVPTESNLTDLHSGPVSGLTLAPAAVLIGSFN